MMMGLMVDKQCALRGKEKLHLGEDDLPTAVDPPLPEGTGLLDAGTNEVFGLHTAGARLDVIRCCFIWLI